MNKLIRGWQALLGVLFSTQQPRTAAFGPVCIVNPAGGEHAVLASAQELMKPLRTKYHYLQFARGELGWRLGPILEDATKKGRGLIEGYVYGDVWCLDRDCRVAFARALWDLGFETNYRTWESDGPEANPFELSVYPRKTPGRFNPNSVK